MKTTLPPFPRFTQSRSGARRCHVSQPLSPNRGVRPPARSGSAMKTRPAGGTGACVRRPCKENRVEMERPSARKALVDKTPSAWALSPGRCAVAEGGAGGGGGRRRGVLGLFRRKKEAAVGKEEAEHRLRVMAVRLLQWRFVNAAAEAVMAVKATAENKIFFAWLKLTEMRNIVAAKRILIQRRKHKLKVIKVLNPQVNLLNRWELLAKRHLEAVGSLIKVLESACLSIPLVEGAKTNLEMVHKFIFSSVDVMLAIEDALGTFFSKAEKVKSLSCELVEIIQEEVEGLVELKNIDYLITSLEMHETSLRTSLIQAKKKENASPPIYEI